MNLAGKAIFPSDAEIAANPRCRSAVLRVAQKV
jgi:16S rRNA (cytosine1402-N4)-methyltransferase